MKSRTRTVDVGSGYDGAPVSGSPSRSWARIRDRASVPLLAVVVACASGLYVAGVGSAVSWFAATSAIVIVASILLAREDFTDDAVLGFTEAIGPLRRYGRTIGMLLGISSTTALAWLVLHRQPMPFADLREAALVTSIFCVVIWALALSIRRLPLLSFPSLFLLSTFLFTCSPLVLYQLEGSGALQSWRLVDVPSIRIAMPVVALAFSSFLVGSLVVSPAAPPIGSSTREGVDFDADARALTLAALFLYAVSLIAVAAFTLSGSGLTLAFEGGYRGFAGARKAGQLSQLLVGGLSWFLPWSLLVLTATVRTRRGYLAVLLLAAPAFAIMLLSGARAGPLAMLLLIASGSKLRGRRIEWKRTVVVMALVAFLVPTIDNLRTTPISAWSGTVLAQAATNQVAGKAAYGQGPVEALLSTTGQSFQTLMGTVMEVPSSRPYQYGRDYVWAIPQTVPFVNPPRLTPSDWMKSILNPRGYAGQGYLQVAEAYLEFGVLGVVCLYLFLGWGLTRLWQALSNRQPDARALAFALIVMMELLTWVRSDATGVVRTTIWGWLLTYGVPWLARRFRGTLAVDLARVRSPQASEAVP